MKKEPNAPKKKQVKEPDEFQTKFHNSISVCLIIVLLCAAGCCIVALI